MSSVFSYPWHTPVLLMKHGVSACVDAQPVPSGGSHSSSAEVVLRKGFIGIFRVIAMIAVSAG